MTIRFNTDKIERAGDALSIPIAVLKAILTLIAEMQIGRNLQLEGRLVLNAEGASVDLEEPADAGGLVAADAAAAGAGLIGELSEMHQRYRDARQTQGARLVPLPTDKRNILLNRAAHVAKSVGVTTQFEGRRASLTLPSVSPADLVVARPIAPASQVELTGVVVGCLLLTEYQQLDLFDDPSVLVRYVIDGPNPINTLCATLPYSRCHCSIGRTHLRAKVEITPGAEYAVALEVPELIHPGETTQALHMPSL